jgi:LacI family fructose operon transcriptional repressor
VRKPQGRSTIYDIAREAGASPSTVSAALSDSWAKRRISAATVERIRRIAAERGYAPNLQARGLRRARSGLVGMILPGHENRFFSSVSQAFAVETRRRGQCPAIVLTGRDPAEQARSVESLMGYAVEALMLVGATDPEPLAETCRRAGVPHVFLDLPCPSAPSIVSDNAHGAQALTDLLLDRAPPPDPDDPRSLIHFLGGDTTLYASAERLKGFLDVARRRGAFFSDSQIIACGYESARARVEIEALHARLGGLPAALFVNSIDAFNGVARFLGALPEAEIAECVIGCYDFDPFGALLRFPVHMVRQKSEAMVSAAFARVDEGTQAPSLALIRPELIIALR